MASSITFTDPDGMTSGQLAGHLGHIYNGGHMDKRAGHQNERVVVLLHFEDTQQSGVITGVDFDPSGGLIYLSVRVGVEDEDDEEPENDAEMLESLVDDYEEETGENPLLGMSGDEDPEERKYTFRWDTITGRTAAIAYLKKLVEQVRHPAYIRVRKD